MQSCKGESASLESPTTMAIVDDERATQEATLTPAVATIQADEGKAKSGDDGAVLEKKPLGAEAAAGHKRKASTDIPSSIPSEIVSNPKSQRVSSSPPVSPSTGQQQLTDPVIPQGGEVNEGGEGGNKGLLIGGLFEGLDLNKPIEAGGEEMEVEPVAAETDDKKIAVVVEKVEVDAAGTNNEVKAASVDAVETKIETDGESDDSVVSPAVDNNEVESYVGADQKNDEVEPNVAEKKEEENKASDVEKSSDESVEINNEVEPPAVEKNEVDQVEAADAMEKKKDKMEVEANPTEEHEVMTVASTSKAEGESSVAQKVDGSGSGSGSGDGGKVVLGFDLNELPPADDEE